MNNGLYRLPVAALATALLAGPLADSAWAQNTKPPAQGAVTEASQPVQLTANEFTIQAAQSNMAEIKLSQLAMERSQNEQIRKFAQQMLTDHEKAGKELKAIAGTMGATVPTDLTAKQQAALAALNQQSGTQFDSAYVRQMQKDHDEAVALFERAGATEQLEPTMRAFARKMLPTLQAHQQSAHKLSSALTQ